MLLMAKAFREKCAKIWCSAQKVLPKMSRKILPEIMVKQNSIFSAVYFTLAPLRIAHIHW
jgi:hypothetical protein